MCCLHDVSSIVDMARFDQGTHASTPGNSPSSSILDVPMTMIEWILNLTLAAVIYQEFYFRALKQDKDY